MTLGFKREKKYVNMKKGDEKKFKEKLVFNNQFTF